MFRSAARRRTLEAALRDLQDRSARVRASALGDLADAVGESVESDSGDPRRASAVAGAARALGDPEAAVRAAAALALADLDASDALSALVVAIEDDDPHVRQMALTAIGEIGDGRARERVRRALDDDRPEVRFQAIIAFPRVAPDEAWSILTHAFADADAGIRHIALRCAEEHAERTGAPCPPDLLAEAARLLADADATVRVAAAIVIGRASERSDRGSQAAHDRQAPVRAVVADLVTARIATRDEEDLAAAIELTGALGWSDLVPALERRAFGWLSFRNANIAWHARVALARLGNQRARGLILRDLGSRSRDKRTLAVAAAGRARLVETRAFIQAMRGQVERADEHAVDEALALLEPGTLPANPVDA